jgi:hypothetical protein
MLLITLILSISLPAGVYADNTSFNDTSFRCGNDIISLGYTMYQIRDECGAPDSAQIVGEKRSSLWGQRLKMDDIIYITEWTYKRESGLYILTFEGSKLVKKEFIKY